MSIGKNLIEINGFANPILSGSNNYANTGNFRIAFASKVIGGKRYQLSREQTCRDYSHEFIRLAFLQAASGREQANSGGLGYYPFKNKVIDLNKLRLLVFSSGQGVIESGAKPTEKVTNSYSPRVKYTNVPEEEVQKRLYFGKRIINMYEEKFGWTKSKIVKAKHFRANDCWHVMGPKGWMRNPHMLSLLTITLRIAIRYGIFDFETVNDITKKYKEFATYQAHDHGILSSISTFLPTLINKMEEVFEGYDEKDLFHTRPGGRLGGFHSSGGISSLCGGQTGIKELNNRVLKMKMKKS